MHRVILLPEYPPAAQAWLSVLPCSIRVDADVDAEYPLAGHVSAVMHYVPRGGEECGSGATAVWSYAHDGAGRILKVEFSGPRDAGLWQKCRHVA